MENTAGLNTVKQGKMSLRLAALMSLAFLIGLLNAMALIDLLPFAGSFSKVIMLLIAAIVGIFSFNLFSTFLKGFSTDSGLQYFLPFMIIITVKYFLLFVIAPGEFVSGRGMGGTGSMYESNLVEFVQFGIVLLPAVLFLVYIKDFYELCSINFCLVIGCAVAPAIGFIFFPEMIGSREVNFHGVYFGGGFWNSSVIGVVAALWPSLSLMSYYSRKKAFVLWAFILFILLGSLVGLSRTAFVSLGGSFVTYLILSKGFIKKTLIAVLVVSGIFIFFKSFDAVSSKMESRYENEGELKEDSRMRVWTDYSEHISEFWAFGVWRDGYRVYSTEGKGPHSIYLNCLARFGVFGLLSYLWLLSGLVMSVFKIRRVYSGATMAIMAAWMVAYLGLVSYNESGFMDPCLYAVMAFFFIQTRRGFYTSAETEGATV